MKLILHMIRGHRREGCRRHQLSSFLKNELSRGLRHRKHQREYADNVDTSVSRSSLEKDVFGAMESLEPAPPTYSESLRSRAVSECSLHPVAPPQASHEPNPPSFTSETPASVPLECHTHDAPESPQQSTVRDLGPPSPPQQSVPDFGAPRGRPQGVQLRYKSQLNEFRLMISPRTSPSAKKPRLQLDLLKMQRRNPFLVTDVSLAVKTADALALQARMGLHVVQMATVALMAFLMASAVL